MATKTRRPRSYHPGRSTTELDREVARLEAQAESSWSEEARALGRIGLEDGSAVLELGCGPGVVTRRLRSLCPQSPIVAVDHDPRMLRRARSLELPGVTWVRAEARCSGLEAGKFDFVLSRYLFQHLPEPGEVAREALRLLRPGGVHVVIDVDDELWGLAEPAVPGMREIYSRVIGAQSRRGGDRCVGRRLGRILRDAGYHDVELGTFSYDSDTHGLDCFLPQIHPDRLVAALGTEDIDPAELGCLYTGYELFRASHAFVLCIGFVAHGRKPS